jgi:hypothetical protein
MVILLLTLDLKDTTEVVLVCNLGEALPEGNHACFNADGLFGRKVPLPPPRVLHLRLTDHSTSFWPSSSHDLKWCR